MIKISQLVNFVINVPTAKKDAAKKILFFLKKIDKKLGDLNDYLDKLYNPFKEFSEVSPESIKEHRGVFHDYSEEIENIYLELKDMSATVVYALKIFEYDSEFLELTKSIEGDFGDLSDLIEELRDGLSNYEDVEYQQNVISTIDKIKEKVESFEDSINNRLVEHINKNVLVKTWLDDAGQDNNEEDVLKKLLNEKQEQVNGIIGGNIK